MGTTLAAFAQGYIQALLEARSAGRTLAPFKNYLNAVNQLAASIDQAGIVAGGLDLEGAVKGAVTGVGVAGSLAATGATVAGLAGLAIPPPIGEIVAPIAAAVGAVVGFLVGIFKGDKPTPEQLAQARQAHAIAVNNAKILATSILLPQYRVEYLMLKAAGVLDAIARLASLDTNWDRDPLALVSDPVLRAQLVKAFADKGIDINTYYLGLKFAGAAVPADLGLGSGPAFVAGGGGPALDAGAGGRPVPGRPGASSAAAPAGAPGAPRAASSTPAIVPLLVAAGLAFIAYRYS